MIKEGQFGNLLLSEGAVQQPGDNREVAALIVGRKEDRVLVLGGGCHVKTEVAEGV